MKLIKNNFKIIIAFIIGSILSSGIVYAVTSASQITYTTTKNAEIETVADALNDLYNKSYNTTLVWTNSNPTSNFPAQTINLDLGKYNYVLIESKRSKNDVLGDDNGINPQYSLIQIGQNGKIMGIDNNYAFHFMKDVSVTTSNITFGTTYRRGYNLPSQDSGADDCAIPLKIYGIKYL